jgi:2'-5' RNA ligase
MAASSQVTTSAVCLIPPTRIWQRIQTIRKDRDHAYERWLPHINLFYPFVEDSGSLFADEQKRAANALCSAHVKPFRIRLSEFGHFKQRDGYTVHLKPIVEELDDGAEKEQEKEQVEANTGKGNGKGKVESDALMRLHATLASVWPDSVKRAQFKAHLTVAQFPTREAMDAWLADDGVAELWRKKPLVFVVRSVYLISRSPRDKAIPFGVRHRVALDGIDLASLANFDGLLSSTLAEDEAIAAASSKSSDATAAAAATARRPVPHKVFVGNLPYSFDVCALHALASRYTDSNNLADVVVPTKYGRSRGFGFVALKSAVAASELIAKMNGVVLEERELRVSEANVKTK